MAQKVIKVLKCQRLTPLKRRTIFLEISVYIRALFGPLWPFRLYIASYFIFTNFRILVILKEFA